MSAAPHYQSSWRGLLAESWRGLPNSKGGALAGPCTHRAKQEGGLWGRVSGNRQVVVSGRQPLPTAALILRLVDDDATIDAL